MNDTFFNSKDSWKWEWYKNEIVSLTSVCSTCKTTLLYDENKYSDKVYYYCPCCNKSPININGGNYKHSQSIIKREIRRKAFPNLYKKVS